MAGPTTQRAENQDRARPNEPVGAREASLAKEPSRFKRVFKLLGPGLITGATEDDPSTIGTCARVGASLGYAPLWAMVLTIPFMMAVQFMSAKIGLVTGRGLTNVIREHASRWVLYPVILALLVANTVNAGADLTATTESLNLLVPAVPTGYFVVPVALLILAVQIWGSYRLIERIFKWLVLSLFAYLGAGILAKPAIGPVLWHTFVPDIHLGGQYLAGIVALMGNNFSPYLYFWQPDLEVEEKKAMGRRRLWQRRGTSDAELKYAAWDVNSGIVVSNVIAYFVIMTSAATLHQTGQTHVESIRQAAESLKPLAGGAASILMAVGLIGGGLLTVPVLTTSAAYAVSAAFGWRAGLDRNFGEAPGFYGVILLSTAAAVGINFSGLRAMDALFLCSLINGWVAPVVLLILLLATRSRKIMGERANGWALNTLGWVTVLVTAALAVASAFT